MNRAAIFTQAHKNAKAAQALSSRNYRDCFAAALKSAYAAAKAPKTVTPEQLAAEIKRVDPRFSAYVEGGLVKGCFRGKRNENYSYMVSNNAFMYNTVGGFANAAIRTAIENLTK